MVRRSGEGEPRVGDLRAAAQEVGNPLDVPRHSLRFQTYNQAYARDPIRPQGGARLPAAPGVLEKAHIKSLDEYRALYERSISDPEGFWAEQAETLAGRRAGTGSWSGRRRSRSGSSAASSTSPRTASTATSPPGAKNKAAIIWEGEPGDDARPHLPGAASRGLQVRQRAQGPGREQGRPRRRSTCRWSPRRRSPCWPARASAPPTASSSAASQREAVARPHERRAGQGRRHRRRRLPARQRRAAEGERGRAPCRSRPTRRRRASWSGAPASTVPMQAGRDHWWHELMARRVRRLPRRAARRRAPALHPLHQRHHREAQGRRAHHRRLPAADRR